MELGRPRREALHDLKRRTEVSEPSNFVLTLTQADTFGTPLRRVPSTSAQEMQARRPVKILCTFPAIFVVRLSPAAADGGGFGS